MHTARIVHQTGAKVLAVSDAKGGIYNSGGLDIPTLISRYNSKTRPLDDCKVGESMTNEELLQLPCTVLVPAALSEQITVRNAARLRCRILAEGANGPTTLEADRILEDQGIFVIPDILANAGGVTVSYFEWVQDRQGYFWNENLVNERLEEIMVTSFADVTRYAGEHGVNNRTAAYMLALNRVANAIRRRGLYA